MQDVITEAVHRAPEERSLRAEHGRSARADRPRSSLATWTPRPDRLDPIEILEDQAVSRVPELLPIRYGRMSDSPFAFFRGAAAVMAADLGPLPHSGLRVQLCGDAHLANFGGFAAPNREMLFDINDFDETHPGPFEWDLQRLGSSFEIAGRSLGLDTSSRSHAVREVGAAYRTAMREFARSTDLDIWYARLDLEGVVSVAGSDVGKRAVKQARATASHARHKDRYRALQRLTERVDGELRFRSDPPLLVPGGQLFPDLERAEIDRRIRQVLDAYGSTLPYKYRRLLERYRYVDIARKVVGVGSVGTRAWVVLLVGRNDDPIFLQVKEAQPSVLEPYVEPSGFSSQGERVVAGQSMIQAAGDVFLGWATVIGPDLISRDYYVRQLWDWKASAAIESMSAKKLVGYARVCGWTLAHAHARTGDAVAIASYLGKGDSFDRALAGFAATYADQNERDFESLQAAIGQGRITARTGI